MTARLNVNIDHVATVRQARRAPEPSVVAAAMLCEEAGADGVTVHLRGDRRHIQDEDIYALRRTVTTYLNVEMAATEEMITVAADARPDAVTLVAERPDEITTEGGLDAVANFDVVCRTVDQLRECGLFVSLFIDPDPRQIEAAQKAGAQQVELCTAAYAEATLGARAIHSEGRARAVAELQRLREAAALAAQYGLHVAAGHGLTYRNVSEVAAVPEITEFNIGHNIIARAVLTGLSEAVREMRARIREAKS
ncbi:MAG: pyridoxine 5'-phosphate synthase [Acidobacteria bacterium]|nr:MAG: pyridoxine 5'-phosphate synthase [Acidobacteriota bacterium]PYS84743.1 MAG: pyridoxine 5'-phosphate synthase [Acidobacteriota bacterium]